MAEQLYALEKLYEDQEADFVTDTIAVVLTGLAPAPGEAVIPAPRRLALLEAGKLKLAAKARLAEGGPEARYEAAVLYHAAARAEQRALLALESPSPEARLASAIERCASLILGFDASAVLDSGWADVLVTSAAVEEKTAAAMRARIEEMMSSFLLRYQDARGKAPALDAWTNAGCPPDAPRSVHRELDRFLKLFPGEALLWALRSSLSFDGGDVDTAWDSIHRALELSPREQSFIGWELRLVSKRLPKAQAEARLAGAYPEIERGEASAEVYGGFIFAAMNLAPKSKHRVELLGQALHAAMEAGRTTSPQSEVRRLYRAMELGLREIIAGRKPEISILYRCGLGRLAATMPQEADWMGIVSARTTQIRPAA
jgi:hypothetical protein